MKTEHILIAVVAAAGLAGGAYFLSQKNQAAPVGGDEGEQDYRVAAADAAARIEEARTREREAELAAETRKREIDALDRPIGEQLFSLFRDATTMFVGGLAGGTLKF